MNRAIKNKSKGFTLIELLVVIAVLGVLVLLAMPKFKGHIRKARIVNIKNDIKVAEGVVLSELIDNGKLPDDWLITNLEELTDAAKDDKLYDVKGLIKPDKIEKGEYVKLTKKAINTKLKGNFYTNQGGKVYYKDIKSNNVPDEPIEKPVNKNELINEKTKAEELDKNLYEDWSEIQNAIDKANTVINNDNVTQQEVDDALLTLKQALQNLVLKPINKDELISEKEKAKELDQNLYEDWSEVQNAINNANSIINKDNANQQEVDDALKALKQALQNLVLKSFAKYYDFDEATGTISNYSEDGPKNAVIPEIINGVTVKIIGEDTFANMNLESLHMPDTIEKVEGFAIQGGTIGHLKMSKNLKVIERAGFIWSGITTIEWSPVLESIGASAFKENKLTNIQLPDSVVSIGDNAFADNQIRKINISSNVDRIGSGVFDDNLIKEIFMKDRYDLEGMILGNNWNSDAKIVFELDVPSKYVLATDDDFSGTANGRFNYIGTDKYVEIPHIIKGIPITSYANMFEDTNVEGVKSTNNNVTDMNNMFFEAYAESLDLRELDTSNVTNMSCMFNESNIKHLNLSNFDTSNVTNMNWMFAFAGARSLDLSSFDTSEVTDMSAMFYGTKATEINLSSFDTSRVTNMAVMFDYSEITELNLENFDTSNVTNMGSMFQATKTTILDLSSFDTSNVTNMLNMFLNTQATIGYARSQKDADKFNASEAKPDTLTFTPK